MRRTVGDVMTNEVVTAGAATPFKELVRLLGAHRISALPVVEGGRLLGVVSEADLALKVELPPLAREPVPHRALWADRRRTAMVKAGATRACELMTSPVVTVPVTATLAEAARLLHSRQVKRAPVVDADGRLVGIVARSDLLGPYLTGDRELAAAIVTEVLDARLGLPWGSVRVQAEDGVMTLTGRVHGLAVARSLVEAVGRFDGVVNVVDRLTVGEG
jgi:CBS domain-containing protein